jgi:hypothetical protein
MSHRFHANVRRVLAGFTLLVTTLATVWVAKAAQAVGHQPPSPKQIERFIACLSGTTNTCHAANVTIILPGDPDYKVAAASLGAKSPRHPAAIVYPPTPEAITDTVICAHQSEIPVSVRNGGHSFQGTSVHSNHIVVDVSKTCDGTLPETTPRMDRENSNLEPTLTITAGCLHADILAALHRNNITDHFAITGGMPLVGYIGWAMGGGFGNTTPYAGLGCDQFINWRLVLFNGTILDANDHSHQGLFRALCGGGINVGVVIHATIRLTPHPDVDRGDNWARRHRLPCARLLHPHYPLLPTTRPPIAALNRLQTLLVSQARVRLGGHGPTIRPGRSPETRNHFCLLYLGELHGAIELLDAFHLLDADLFGRGPSYARSRFSLASLLRMPIISNIASPAFSSTPPQLAIVNHTLALRPTLALLATHPHANIILAETPTYPQIMAPMILVDSLAMHQTNMCEVLEGMGGSCSGAQLPHFGSRPTTDAILETLLPDRGSKLFDVNVSTRLGDERNEYRRKFAPGVVIDDVVDVATWQAIMEVMETRKCSFMIPHLLGGRIRDGDAPSHHRTFSWTNGTLVFGVVSPTEAARLLANNLEDNLDEQERLDNLDRQYQWMCLHEFHKALHASHVHARPGVDEDPHDDTSIPPIKAYYNYLGEDPSHHQPPGQRRIRLYYADRAID